MNVAQGNLGLSASGLFTRFIVTHVSIRTRDISSSPYEPPSQTYTTLLYHPITRIGSQASADHLAPLNLPRRPTRPGSYYAFFKGWLLLSQPPGCLCLPTSFSTEWSIGGLSCGSGLFPFSRRTFAPAVCLPCSALVGIRSLHRFGKSG